MRVSRWTTNMRSWLALLCALCAVGAALAAPVNGIEGPFVSNITSSSAVIWWRGETPAPGKVFIDESTLRDDEAPFEVLVSDLESGSEYPYYVELDSGQRLPAEGTYVLRTSPRRGDSDEFLFAVMCDSRGVKPSEPVNAAVLQALLKDAKSRSAQFVCFPGDLIFGYCHSAEDYREQLRLWQSAAAEVMHEMPIYATMGNHDVVIHRTEDRFGKYDLDGVMVGDVLVTGEELFSQEFVNPENGPQEPEQEGAPLYGETCYSFDYGNSHFIFINTNYWMGTRAYPHEPGDPYRLYERGNPEGRLMDKQLSWLQNDLRQARRAAVQHIFLFGHEPAYPVSKHADDAMYYEGNATLSLKRDVRARRHRFWKMLSDYGVLVAFFGDEHNYSRGLMGPVGDREYDPAVWHVITGGAGAPPAPKFRTDLPWSDSIRVFENRLHYCLVRVHGRHASLAVLALPEGFNPEAGEAQFELIDRAPDLTIRD